jgi:hypothetical protein
VFARRWLLPSRNEGASGDVIENKGGRKEGFRYEVSDVRRNPPFGNGGGGAKCECAYDGISWEVIENAVASSDKLGGEWPE